MVEVKDLEMGLGVTDRIMDRVRDLVGVEHVFGTPIERDGTTVIPVAKIRHHRHHRRCGSSRRE